VLKQLECAGGWRLLARIALLLAIPMLGGAVLLAVL
jgi:hypothetical protein